MGEGAKRVTSGGLDIGAGIMSPLTGRGKPNVHLPKVIALNFLTCSVIAVSTGNRSIDEAP